MLTPQLLPLGPMSLNMLCLTLCSYLAVQALYMPDAVEFHFLHSVSKVGSLCHTPWSLKTYTHEPQLPPPPPPSAYSPLLSLTSSFSNPLSLSLTLSPHSCPPACSWQQSSCCLCRPSTIEAIAPCTLWTLQVKDLDTLVDLYPELAGPLQQGFRQHLQNHLQRSPGHKWYTPPSSTCCQVLPPRATCNHHHCHESQLLPVLGLG